MSRAGELGFTVATRGDELINEIACRSLRTSKGIDFCRLGITAIAESIRSNV